jgi:hypothetical protein
MADAEAERFDGILLNVAQQAGSIENILDIFFGFLNRKTDFFTGAQDENAAEALVLKYYKKHWKAGQKKRAEQQEKNRRADEERKARAEEKKKKDEEKKELIGEISFETMFQDMAVETARLKKERKQKGEIRKKKEQRRKQNKQHLYIQPPDQTTSSINY